MSEHNPYAPPEAPPEHTSRGQSETHRPHVDGDALVVHQQAKLPKRCIKCATKADLVELPSPFEYVPMWARIGFGALGALAFRRSVTLALPFCVSCKLVFEERRSAYRRVALAVLGLVFLPGLLAAMADRDARGPLAFLTVVAMVGGLVFLNVRRRSQLDPYTVRCDLVKDNAAWLLGACPAFVERATRPPKRALTGASRT
jgi:hypothetical protein